MVLKVTGRSLLTFAYGTVTSCGCPFQGIRLASRLVTPLGPRRDPAGPYYPRLATTAVLNEAGLGCSPFARHYSGNVIFSWGY